MHDFNHGNYKHICSHCYKQGHSLSHLETKCNLKMSKHATNSSRQDTDRPPGATPCVFQDNNSDIELEQSIV